MSEITQHPAGLAGTAAIAAASLFGTLGVLMRILIEPVNHTGLDVRWMWWLYALGAVAGAVQCLMRRRFSGLPALLTLVCLGGLIFGVVVDHWNLLVEHDEWCRRGMPSRWDTAGYAPR